MLLFLKIQIITATISADILSQIDSIKNAFSIFILVNTRPARVVIDFASDIHCVIQNLISENQLLHKKLCYMFFNITASF